ncbi:hypothetical protein BDZ91DRAFT_786041 [Kalaharituber pfeilii]|nr:hypothetical protein BDZ91DRAFT_786041 [Kalaharituber pfeilii]
MSLSTATGTLSAKQTWTPHTSLPKELVSVVIKVVEEMPELHCEEPMDGEQYAWPNMALDRLQDYAFTKGFAVVTLSGSEKKGRIRYGCVHHGKPRDTRKLEAEDSEVQRRRQTNTQAKECLWAISINLRVDIDSGTDTWVRS